MNDESLQKRYDNALRMLALKDAEIARLNKEIETLKQYKWMAEEE